MADQPILGDVKMVAQIAGLHKSTLNKLRIYNPSESPPFLRIGRKVMYPLRGPNSLESWIASRSGGSPA